MAQVTSTYEPIISILPISKGGTNSNTALTNNKTMVSVGGKVVESSISTTELGYLSGVSSNIQTQINNISPNGNYLFMYYNFI